MVRQTDRQKGRCRDRQTEGQMVIQTVRKKDTWRASQTDRDRRRDRHTERRAHRQENRPHHFVVTC